MTVRRFKKGPCEECKLLKGDLAVALRSREHWREQYHEALTSRDYWREHYQAEANENTAIRELFGIDPTEPDETLTAERVKQWLADNTKTGDETR